MNFVRHSRNFSQKITFLSTGSIWKHYKGNLYRVITFSKSTDNLKWYVVYEPLYHTKFSKERWHRDIDEFKSTVTHNNKIIQRFTFVSDDE